MKLLGFMSSESLRDGASVTGNECKVTCESVSGGDGFSEGFEYEY
jgi:hypothetical protein